MRAPTPTSFLVVLTLALTPGALSAQSAVLHMRPAEQCAALANMLGVVGRHVNAAPKPELRAFTQERYAALQALYRERCPNGAMRVPDAARTDSVAMRASQLLRTEDDADANTPVVARAQRPADTVASRCGAALVQSLKVQNFRAAAVPSGPEHDAALAAIRELLRTFHVTCPQVPLRQYPRALRPNELPNEPVLAEDFR